MKGPGTSAHSSAIETAATANATAADVSVAFDRQMAMVQSQYEQLQRIQNDLKLDESRFRKDLLPIQKELDATVQQLAKAHESKKNLEKQLHDTVEVIRQLEVKKEMLTERVCGATATAEQRRAQKLGALGIMQVKLHDESRSTTLISMSILGIICILI